MAKERLSMREIREILRLKYECHLTDRQIAKNCLVARSTVASYLSRTKSAGLKWPLSENISDTDIYNRMYKSRGNRPPMEYIHSKLIKEKRSYPSASVVRV
jgi:hypothetical protein